MDLKRASELDRETSRLRRWGLIVLGVSLLLALPQAQAAADSLTWSVASVDSPNHPTDISCPSVSLCVAVDPAGNAVTSTNPTGGAAAWTVAGVSSSGLNGISCPSASLCVAAGSSPGINGGADVVTSTNPTGGAGAWTTTHVEDFTVFTDVSCPSATLCVAVDGNGNAVTSTNPTGGAGTWTVAHVNTFISPLQGVSCASVSLCVAVDGAGDVVTSTNPTGGAGAWTAVHVASGTLEGGVSCPSVSLCVAVGPPGEAVTSTNPTGGAAAWTATGLGQGELAGISCPSVSFCVAGNSDGDMLTSTDPTGGAAAWTLTDVAGSSSIYGVDCPSASLCVAVDFGGNAIVGTPAVLPVNTSLPTISGTAQVGQTLSCAPGSWSGSAPQTYTYQWQREGSPIGSATGQAYLAATTDQGHTLTCVVTAHNGAGPSAPATSAPTGAVQAGPVSGAGTTSTAPVPPVAIQVPEVISKAKPLKCHKGFKKKTVKGKAKCVKVHHKKHHHKH